MTLMSRAMASRAGRPEGARAGRRGRAVRKRAGSAPPIEGLEGMGTSLATRDHADLSESNPSSHRSPNRASVRLLSWKTQESTRGNADGCKWIHLCSPLSGQEVPPDVVVENQATGAPDPAPDTPHPCRLGRKVASKVLPEEYASDPEARRGYERVAGCAGRGAVGWARSPGRGDCTQPEQIAPSWRVHATTDRQGGH